MPFRAFVACAVVLTFLMLHAGAARAALPRPDHVVVVVEENRGADEIFASSSAGFINSLARSGAALTDFYALSHPSQPNYLNLFSGSDQGVSDDDMPGNVPFATPNLAAALRAKGLSFGGYSESLPSTGWTGETSGNYARKHNPWVNWQSSNPSGNQLPSSVNMSMSSFPTDYSKLPTVSFVVPNNANNMHDGSISAGDSWLSSHLGAYNTWARSHNSMLVVTWDEDDYGEDNRVATIVSGQVVKSGASSSTRYGQFDLLRTISDMYGVSRAGAAGGASDIANIWNTTTTTPTITKTLTFRKGSSNYAGGHDTYVSSSGAASTHGSATPIVAGQSPKSEALVRFDSLVGSGSSQIPHGAKITSAQLTLQTSSGSVDGSKGSFGIHRLLKGFSESSTWNSLSSGISTDGIESLSAADATLTPGTPGKLVTFDVTKSVQAWANGSSDFGWVITANTGGTDAWRWQSDEFSNVSLRPTLKVSFTTTSPSATPAPALAATSVPEPGALLFLLCGGGAALLRRRRYHRSSCHQG